MENTETNKTRMFTTVWGVLMEFEAIWAANLGLKELVDLLKAYIDAISGKRPMADAKTGGVTTDKKSLKNVVIRYIVEVGKPLAAVFFKEGNMELHAKVSFSRSALKALDEDEIADTGIEVARLATENLLKGKKNGLTQEKITKLDEEARKYKSAITKGRELVSKRGASKKSRRVLIKEATVMLSKQMDGVMEVYHTDNTEFWTAYTNGRKIVDYGIRHEVPKKKASTKKKTSSQKTKASQEAATEMDVAEVTDDALNTAKALKTSASNGEAADKNDKTKEEA